MEFDPNAAAVGDGIFGLPYPVEESRFVVVPVPFDATTSYRDGTRNGPAAVLEASRQVDLFDVDFGRPYEHGIAMMPVPPKIAAMNRQARRLAKPIIAAGGDVAGKPALKKALARVNALGASMNAEVEKAVGRILDRGRTAVLLGGDHSTPFGAIKAYAARHPGLGILHIDAHADLRDAYEGFEWSHASIFHNIATRIGARGGVSTLVQVGVRDLGEDEHDFIKASPGAHGVAIATHFDAQLSAEKFAGRRWSEICDGIVAKLPQTVYVSVDIDGFDPALCPGTGTPVPGGLLFNEFLELLRAVRRAGRRVVGADLNEVAPSPATRPADWGGDWNANVGARVLYKLIGLIAATT